MDAVAAAADARWLRDAGSAHVVPRVLWTPPLPPWEAARSADLRAEPGVDFVIDTSPWRERKAAALRAHRTQHQSIDTHFFDQPDIERILATEVYRQGLGPALPGRPSGDPFAGIEHQ
jgi:LmbE family N-acetylglucosaminyl deacetylase